MTDLSIAKKLSPYKPKHKVRFVTAASLFDGHDASINIMRRILQSTGSEVIHLGHNRSVQEIVNAALQEDVQGICITSYQGGHVEFFKYMIDLLKANGGENIKVFGGGGGVIVPAEIKELHEYGVTRIYAPEDGVHMGLQGMINEVVQQSDVDLAAADVPVAEQVLAGLAAGDKRLLARVITLLENGAAPALKEPVLKAAADLEVPVLGITGTGGAGKSSLTDEIVRRFRLDQGDTVKIGLISIDPSRKRTGGALLGDRIRMNAIEHPNIFMRSLATRDTGSEISAALPEVIAACKLAGFDLVIVETSGIGQGDAAIVPFVDASMYVMTPEFGAASQLEKIDMLDFADFVAINKFDSRAPRMRCATSGSSISATASYSRHRPTTCRCSGPRQRASTMMVLRPCTRPWCRCSSTRGSSSSRASCHWSPSSSRRPSAPSCRRSACAIWPRSPTACAATTPTPTSR